jgi:hypothetical protein
VASENKERAGFEREVVGSLRELLAWIKLEARPRAAARLVEILDSAEKKLVYEYSNGTRGVREVGEITGVDKNVVLTWWKEWDGLGIMEQATAWKGRRQRLVSLEDVGIEVPELPKKEG